MRLTYNTSNRSATYVEIGEEDAATFEAISAGRQFEDIQARMTFRLLQKMMLKEEMAIEGQRHSPHIVNATGLHAAPLTCLSSYDLALGAAATVTRIAVPIKG
jgi:hypothetical protein